MAAVAGVGVCGGISGVVEPGGKASGVVGFEGQNSFDEAESICIAGGTWKHVIRKPPFFFSFLHRRIHQLNPFKTSSPA